MLRWEQDEDGDWVGFSGAERVASAHKATPPWAWGWHLACDRDRHHGPADTPEAARGAAEAAWGEWCRTAGLAPVGWRPIAEAPRDGTWIMAWGGAFPFAATVDPDGTVRDHHGDEVDIYDDEPPTQWWTPMPPPPPEAPASGLVPAYKAGEGDGA